MHIRQAVALATLSLGWTAALCQLATTINDNSSTPAAPTGTLNVMPQTDRGRPTANVTHFVLYPTIQVNCPPFGDLSAPVTATFSALAAGNGGIIDARRCQNATAWSTSVTITQPNTVLLLPCAAIAASQPLTIAAGVRNVAIHGCSYQGGKASSGTSGGTVWNLSGSGPAFLIGDLTDTVNTQGFTLTDMAITTAGASSVVAAMIFHRTQEIDLRRVYFIGDNSTGQIGLQLDGSGNYSGGTFDSVRIASFNTAVSMLGNGTGAANASTFVRLHINCSTSGGSPITGTFGIDLQYGDGNTFTGGDVEGCDTMLHLGSGAANNTFVGLRNENSNHQIVADAGSSYNLWVTGGTMFTGALTDAGTHNSFQDAFHRGFNQLTGDIWRGQADTTVTNHTYTGIGLGHVRGLQSEYITDVPGSAGNYQNAWLFGPGDGTTGSQVWVLTDMLSSVIRFGANQTTAGSGNDQTYMNSTGTAGVCVNCSVGSGTGGFSVGSGGATITSIWGTDGSGNTTQYGYQRFWNAGAETWRFDCITSAACGITSYGTGSGKPHIRMFGAGSTELDSEGSSAVTVNNTSGSGTGGLIVYEGGSNSGVAALTITGSGTGSVASNFQIGSASGTGNGVIGNHLNQLASTDFAGACTVTGSNTSCTISFQHSWNNQPACGVTPGFSPGVFYWYTWATNVVTVHEASSADGTFYVICAGNPN